MSLNRYPTLLSLSRKGGLEWTGGEIFGLIMFVVAVYALCFVVWPMVIRDGDFAGDFQRHPFEMFLAFGVVPMGYLWLTGGSLWVIQRRARSNLAFMIGSYGVFDDTAASIEADLGDQVLGAAALQMGRLWAAYVRRESCFLVPMPQIVWAYETTDGISLNTRSGNHYHAKLSPAERAAAVSHLKRVMPWIAFGFSAPMVHTWQDDRVDMLALVDRAQAEGVTFDSIAHPGLRSWN